MYPLRTSSQNSNSFTDRHHDSLIGFEACIYQYLICSGVARSDMRTAAEDSLDRPVEVAVISFLEFFIGSTKNWMTRAALETEIGIEAKWQSKAFMNSVRAAYHLWSCKDPRFLQFFMRFVSR
jgi:hypothetical protein